MKPILFNTEMVRAILEGRKTVTRRVVKPQPLDEPMCFHDEEEGVNIVCHVAGMDVLYNYFPPYQPGDILYVRETWRPTGVLSEPYAYRASEEGLHLVGESGEILTIRYRWRPSIHMPKEAARIFLRVTGVRVERLWDIGDCTREGVPRGRHATAHMNDYDERCDFKYLWDSTIKPADRPLYGWEANPWVWVIEFERVSKEEAQKGGR